MSVAEPAPPQRRWIPLIVKILIGLVIIVGAILGYGMTLPDDILIQRSAMMLVPPEEAFAQVNNFHNWQHWSPWAKLDPNAKNTFEGPASGEGAAFRWSGNDEVGEGKMTITEVTPHERIKMRLDFEKPMKDTSITEFTFMPEGKNGENTVVTWSMSGRHQNVVWKLMCKIMNMDKMVGDKFEEGLASLKEIVEKKS